MLVKFPVWEYYNTQLGFSLQLNSNTKKDFLFAKIESPFLCSWSYYFTAPYVLDPHLKSKGLNLWVHYSLCFRRLEMYNDDSEIYVFVSTRATADLC